jgi:geranylgeranyl diphosphate synthase type I
MDGSDTRRGEPSVHRRFEAAHAQQGWRGSPESFGTSAAILLGDMCLVWADLALATSGLTDAEIMRGEPVWHGMRSELMAGQYLDVLAQATGAQEDPVQRALRVARFKSGKYTVERPLHLGAALADGSPELVETYSAYGIPLGEAFQLRDDLLGVFGDPAVTGKPAGDDLREGKRTVLLACALDRATPAQSGLVERLLGDSELDLLGVAALREVIVDTGALDRVESMIGERTEASLAALEGSTVEDAAAGVLRGLALEATDRAV